MEEITIVKGLEQCPQAADIRQEIFVEEQGFVVEFDEIDPIAWHLLLWQDGAALATGRIYPKEGEEGTLIAGRIAVRKAARGSQLGRRVMECLEEQGRNMGFLRMELSAQVQARGFYEKLGYVARGEEYLDEHCPHITMSKALQ